MARPNYANRFRRLAHYIERQPEGQFDQGLWFHPCGTPACIAGHAARMLGWRSYLYDYLERKGKGDMASKVAGRYLGVSPNDFLFNASAPWRTSAQAAAELRRRANALELS